MNTFMENLYKCFITKSSCVGLFVIKHLYSFAHLRARYGHESNSVGNGTSSFLAGGMHSRVWLKRRDFGMLMLIEKYGK